MVFSFGVEFVAELPIQKGCSAPGFGPAPPICTLYYNINTVREKVVFLKFRQICQKLRAKNSSYGKNSKKSRINYNKLVKLYERTK